MDKRDLLGRLAANGDERLLLGRVWDKYEQCRRRNIPVVTGFLSPAEQAKCAKALRLAGFSETDWAADGGYDGAERRMLPIPIAERGASPHGEAAAPIR